MTPDQSPVTFHLEGGIKCQILDDVFFMEKDGKRHGTEIEIEPLEMIRDFVRWCKEAGVRPEDFGPILDQFDSMEIGESE